MTQGWGGAPAQQGPPAGGAWGGPPAQPAQQFAQPAQQFTQAQPTAPTIGANGQPTENPLGDERYPSLSWKGAPIGATVTGIVLKVPAKVQARKYAGPGVTGPLDFWPDGNPKFNIVTEIEITAPAQLAGQRRAVFAGQPSALLTAMREAQTAAGAYMAPGGRLELRLVDRKDVGKGEPQSLFAVRYTPPLPDNPLGVEQHDQQGQQGSQWGQQAMPVQPQLPVQQWAQDVRQAQQPAQQAAPADPWAGAGHTQQAAPSSAGSDWQSDEPPF